MSNQEQHSLPDLEFVDVAVDLPTGVERDVVLQRITTQVARVAELLANLPPGVP